MRQDPDEQSSSSMRLQYTQPLVEYCGEIRDATALKELIDSYDLICNNEAVMATRPTSSQMTLVIDITFTTLKLGALNSEINHKKPPIPPNHEMIMSNLVNLYNKGGSMEISQEVVS